MKGGIFLPKPLKKDTHIKVYCSNKEKKIKKDKIENKVDLDRIFGTFFTFFSYLDNIEIQAITHYGVQALSLLGSWYF